MTDEERKAWEECVERVRRWIIPADCDGPAILAADAVIRRAGDVEGLAKAIYEHIHANYHDWIIEPDYIKDIYRERALVVSAWILKTD